MKTRQEIADKIVALLQRDVDNQLRETDGQNRSERIDSFNARIGVELGSPYCASGAWCAIDDACKELGLKNPVPKTASSQAFRNPKFVPAKYIRPPGELGKKGDAAIFQVVGDSNRGHYATLKEDQIQEKAPNFETLEYNTNLKGSRDGDGCYALTRSTDGRMGTNKFFICFTDIPQWIFDKNNENIPAKV